MSFSREQYDYTSDANAEIGRRVDANGSVPARSAAPQSV